MSETQQSTALAVAQERGLTAFDGDGPNQFESYANDKGVSNGALMRFNGNTGEFNANQQPIEHGTVLAFDIFNAKRGYVRWSNQKIVERIMEPFMGGKPLPEWDELNHNHEKVKETDGWVENIQTPVYDIEGGPAMDFSLPSADHWRPINRLVKEYGQKMRMQRDPDMIPLVEISTRSFDSKGGKKYAPVLKITDWIHRDELVLVDENAETGDAPVGDAAASQIAAPAAGVASAPAPATQQGGTAQPVTQPQPAAAQQQPQTAAAPQGYRRGRVGQRA